jgi:2-amino-4-hydroxy-6-hydroxymethyldihydropteridine diphosphokinase
VAIALGSNVGERLQHLEHAVAALAVDLADMKVSPIIETQPIGVGQEHGAYLNAAVIGQTRLGPRELLARLLHIEQQSGRTRPYPTAPRTLDLDLVLYGDLIVDEDGLRVPHPRFREREFVLAPLAEIAPHMVDPVTGRTVQALLVAQRNNRV